MAIQRGLPTFNADGSAVVLPSRTGSYGEAYVLPLGAGKLHAFADEGSYFVGYNVTDGTGIAGHAAPVQADLSTMPLLQLFPASDQTQCTPQPYRSSSAVCWITIPSPSLVMADKAVT
jgi:hypothetical protein